MNRRDAWSAANGAAAALYREMALPSWRPWLLDVAAQTFRHAAAISPCCADRIVFLDLACRVDAAVEGHPDAGAIERIMERGRQSCEGGMSNLLRTTNAIHRTRPPRRIEFAPENLLVLGAGLIVITGLSCAVGYFVYLIIALAMGSTP